MNYAKIEQLKEIMNIFRLWKEVFPHVRQDYIQRKTLAQEVIYQSGVVITFNKYKVRVKLGTVTIPKSSYIIHQIVNKNQGNGKAKIILDQFCNMVENDNSDLYLAVRASNELAKTFYVKYGFKLCGSINWDHGKLPGLIYVKRFAKPFPGVL